MAAAASTTTTPVVVDDDAAKVATTVHCTAAQLAQVARMTRTMLVQAADHDARQLFHVWMKQCMTAASLAAASSWVTGALCVTYVDADTDAASTAPTDANNVIERLLDMDVVGDEERQELRKALRHRLAQTSLTDAEYARRFGIIALPCNALIAVVAMFQANDFHVTLLHGTTATTDHTRRNGSIDCMYLRIHW